MPTVKVPLGTIVYKGIDDVEVKDNAVSLIDGFITPTGWIARRGGLSQQLDLGTNSPVTGLFWDEAKGILYAVSGNNLYKITQNNTGGYTSTLLGAVGGGKPVFATDRSYVFVTTGDKIYYTDGTTLAQLGGGSPSATHIAYLDGYILAAGINGNTFNWSDLQNPFNWDSLNFAQASGSPDAILALATFNRELYLIGSQTTEIWENVGGATITFQRVAGGFIEVGTSARYSIIRLENSMMWLDNNKRFIEFDLRRIRRLATPYDTELDRFSRIDDCIGFKFEMAGFPFAAFYFPTENRTLVFNRTFLFDYEAFTTQPDTTSQQAWSEFGLWNDYEQRYDAWIIRDVVYVPLWNKFIAASRKDGKLYELHIKYNDDAGTPIRLSRKTGFIDYGSTRRKLSREIRIKAKRGEEGSNNAKAFIRWRNDNRQWNKERTINLGNTGDNNPVARLFTGGTYRTRQYEIYSTDNVRMLIGDAEEDLEVL